MVEETEESGALYIYFNVVMVVKAKTKDACEGIGGETCDPDLGEGAVRGVSWKESGLN